MMVGREVSLVGREGPGASRARSCCSVDGPRGRRRPRHDRRRRRRLRGPRRRDLRHRRRRGQRAGRARRGADRPAPVDGGTDRLAGDDVTNAFAPRHVRPRRRLRPRRPAAVRAGPVLPDRGQPRPHRFPRPAVLALRRHRRGAIARRADELIPEFDIRTPSGAVPAATLSGGNQQKVIVAREFSRAADAAHRRPADPRDRRRVDRVHPQADRRQARRGHGRPARLRRAGRGARAERPDRRDVPRPARGDPRRPSAPRRRRSA